MLNYLATASPYYVIVKDPFAKKARLYLITSTLFVVILHTHENRRVLDILIRIPFNSMQDSIKETSHKIP